jgi:predicted ArsR family transcriptional regulator
MLVDLLGDTRASIVDELRRQAQSVAELAATLGLSEVAIRRHLQVLERDGLVDAQTVRRDGPGRPSARYALTDRAHRLFPDNSAQLAIELLTYLEQEHGHDALARFMRWRVARQGGRYATALSGVDSREGPTRLAELLSADGYFAQAGRATDADGRTVLELTQGHCAIKEVAEQHPEICAYETQLFSELLGTPVSREMTIAGGAPACVCHITDDCTSKPL